MTAEMTVGVSPEKVRQLLLKYLETRDDITVRSSESTSIQVRTLGWRHPWAIIEIRMFEEENNTRLAFNFDFSRTYAIFTIAVMVSIATLWVTALIRPENAGYAIGAIIGILATIPIGFASDMSKAKRKFPDDIGKAFDMLNETD